MKPKRTARQSGTVESFGEGMCPDYLVFTDEYGRRWRLESQFAQLEAENEVLKRELADEKENNLKYLKAVAAATRKETPCP